MNRIAHKRSLYLDVSGNFSPTNLYKQTKLDYITHLISLTVLWLYEEEDSLWCGSCGGG